jgi:hypothetical protein
MKHWLLLVVLAGCADAIDDELGEIESEVTGTNKLAANKLAANKLAANKLAAIDEGELPRVDRRPPDALIRTRIRSRR